MLVSTTIAKSYICEEVLGVGAFGKVYKVSKTDSGEIFALKEIDESLCLASSMSLTGELDIYPQLQSRYIVNCTRVLRDPEIEHVYLEMEYYNGGTLEEFIMQHRRRQEPIPELQIWEILAQIAAGLAYLHSQIKTGSLSVVVHRDIKPANILFLDDDVKIADFGFCRPLELVSITGSASVQKVLGTPAYLAPEILNGQSCTQKVDIWSLGCIILELCTLEIPTSIADTPIEPYLQQLSGYSNTIKLVIRRCLERIPYARQEMCIANNLGETALMYAAEEGHIKCVQYLRTEAGMSDVDKSTALLRTLLNGYMGCATILLASEQKISNVTSLMIAAASGDVETAELYIGEASKRDALGRTALMYAARQGHASCVSLLMRYEQGIVDFSGYTALAHSVQAEQLNCVKLLVNEAHIPTGFGETVEAMARSQGHMRIARFLRKKPR